MKILGFLFLLVASVFSLRASATAYQALEYYEGRSGDGVLHDVFLVRGEHGNFQPSEWVVFRGGPNTANYHITGIKSDGMILSGVASRRNAGMAPNAQPINFSMLNVDSNAAYEIARKEARKENFTFNRMDYELRTNPLAGVPAWSMLLLNEKKSYLAELTISGATGEVLYTLKLHRYTVEDIEGHPELITVREPWPRRALRSVGRWFSQTGTTFGKDLLRAAGTTEEIVIGRRTRDYADDVN